MFHNCKLTMWHLLLVLALLAVQGLSIRRESLSNNFVNAINKKKSTWQAGNNFHENTPLEHLRRLGSGVLLHTRNISISTYENINFDEIPDSFDSRLNWPLCESLREIRSQGHCAGCWAFATAEVMTDRLCIQTNGTTKFKFSPEDLLTCCATCGTCMGGDTWEAWHYWINQGLVSGGDIGSKEGCQPISSVAYNDGISPECVRSCEPYYPVTYEEDKHYGTEMHNVPLEDLRQLQYEIMMNGPAVAIYRVFEDFYSYKSGVYQYVSGELVGMHAVKILGWGVEQGSPYWLIANSWGNEWGDRGFFKILRGANEVGIEENVAVGTARLD